MKIRKYVASDKQACLEIFNSNCPQFFDKDEYPMFEKWLDHQGAGSAYSSPTYKNSEHDDYSVVELKDGSLAGCGGFYISTEPKEARLAWGMIRADLHKKGYGTLLYLHRRDLILKDWPHHPITLGTSQHTFPFYQKMGLNVVNMIPSGYGPALDRYDMNLGSDI